VTESREHAVLYATVTSGVTFELEDDVTTLDRREATSTCCVARGAGVRIVVGITGATGAVFGIRILEELADLGVETHLCISRWGRMTIEHETTEPLEAVRSLATRVPASGNMGAEISSGSFLTDGMIIAPCSMRSLAAIANGVSDNLVTRAADEAVQIAEDATSVAEAGLDGVQVLVEVSEVASQFVERMSS
jgi:Flavoprotein